ncbi:tetratricopeptide repeat protein [Pseudokineococcus sp. 1T1Z-3]|uniref:tetratricopeptide repeat protein n=1 Tax=Pseudokineococcus sp. 1T1Z-3 TaxID=3132745 RepID=UPI003096354F
MATADVEDWESRVRRVWASAATQPDSEVLQAVEALATERPPRDPAALFERASAHDYAGQEAYAEGLYRQALGAGLTGDRRAQAVIQLASTLRLLGRPGEAVDLLEHEPPPSGPDDLGGARAAFLALALADAGQGRRALETALTALAEHLPRYQRAVRHYAHDPHPGVEEDAADAAGAVSVRGYEPADAAATREVFTAAVRRTALSHYTEGQVQAWAPDHVDLDRWAQRRSLAWTVVAVEGGRVVGFADLTSAGEMDMLFVHPDAARRGVATALVTAVTAEAARRGLRRVDVRASRVLQPLLERLGFTLDADRPDNRVRGQVVPNAAMHLDLPAPPESHAADLDDGGDVRQTEWNPLVPELLVHDLAASQRFYVDVIGFGVRYERPDPPFAYLDLAGAKLMLEQDHDRAWHTGDLTGPPRPRDQPPGRGPRPRRRPRRPYGGRGAAVPGAHVHELRRRRRAHRDPARAPRAGPRRVPAAMRAGPGLAHVGRRPGHPHRTGEPVIIRPRHRGDLPGCVAALRRVHETDGYPTWWPPDPAAWLTPPGWAAAWVAVDDDEQALGHVCVVRCLDDPVLTAATGAPAGRLVTISRLFSAPAVRGRGLSVGTQLLAAAQEWVDQQELQLILDVVDDGAPAVQLYERLGWQLVDVRDADWTTPQGHRHRVRFYRAPQTT